MAQHRDSDRWVTPGVVMLALFLGTIVVLAVVAAVTYLTARGYDPEPVVQLVAQVVTAVGALGSLMLQLAGRRTVAKTERNTGTLARAVDSQSELMFALDDAVRQLEARDAERAAPAAATNLGIGRRPPPVPGRETAPVRATRD